MTQEMFNVSMIVLSFLEEMLTVSYLIALSVLVYNNWWEKITGGCVLINRFLIAD